MADSFCKSMAVSPLDLVFFGGKGGVGKTTSASAFALAAASKCRGRRILLLSTDPAHSLGDCFEMEAGDDIRDVKGVSNLFVRELDASRSMKAFLAKHEAELKTLAIRGTYFDAEDVESFLNLTLPGADEIAALLEISSLLREKKYDTIIVDTAPYGHTLAMLKLPGLLDRWLDFFELMQSKHHIMQEHFARRRIRDNIDEFLAGLKGELAYLKKHLTDHDKTEFVVVTTPGTMDLDETRRLEKDLREMGIPSRRLIVNRAGSRRGAKNESDVAEKLRSISGNFPDMRHFEVPMFKTPVRGMTLLKEYASILDGEDVRREVRDVKCATAVSPDRIPIDKVMDANGRLLIVAGKGGVGKTTVAAATALRLAKRYKQMNFLLLSIDPAHSLSGVFDRAIGNRKTRIRDNLFAIEIDSQSLLAQFQDGYREDIDSLFDSFFSGRNSSVGIDLKHDREMLHSLICLSPPGLDELMALQAVVSLWDEQKDRVDCIVLDTAPTGHLIRFIEMPDLVRQWLNAIFKLFIKYKGIVQLGGVAEKLVAMSRQMRKTLDILTDRRFTRAMAIAVPEAMIVAETGRLVEALEKKHIAVTFLVANMISGHHSGEGGGDADSRGESLRRLHKIFSGSVVEVPLFDMEVIGVERLEEFGGMIFQ